MKKLLDDRVETSHIFVDPQALAHHTHCPKTSSWTATWSAPNPKPCAAGSYTAARITRGQRRLYLRLAEHWHWPRDLAAAFTRLALIPHPLRT